MFYFFVGGRGVEPRPRFPPRAARPFPPKPHGLSPHAVVVLRIDLNLVAYEEQGGCGVYRQQRSYYNNAFHCI